MSVRNVEVEMVRDKFLCERLGQDDDFAQRVYAALCNNQFVPTGENTKLFDESRVTVPAEEREDFWSCSWRCAGGIVADIRNAEIGASECYMDWYCSGAEGCVSKDVREAFRCLNWDIRPWPEHADEPDVSLIEDETV